MSERHTLLYLGNYINPDRTFAFIDLIASHHVCKPGLTYEEYSRTQKASQCLYNWFAAVLKSNGYGNDRVYLDVWRPYLRIRCNQDMTKKKQDGHMRSGTVEARIA